MLSAEDYLDALLALLPPGAVWSRDAIEDIEQFLRGLANELYLVDSRGQELLLESDPRFTSEMLPDWEAASGLPGPCGIHSTTIRERREAVVRLFVSAGSLSRQFYIDLAEVLGFPGAVITDYTADDGAADDDVDGDDWFFTWRLSVPRGPLYQFDVMDSVDQSLGEASPADRLECFFNRLKPAHTIVRIVYTT